MKKLLSMAALVGITAAAQNVQALSWTVECVKQGPARGYDARSLKPGNSARPNRLLAPGAGNPGNTAGYPIGARSIPGQAIVAEQSDISGAMNFISLGFGGQIVLRSTEWISNGPASDFTVFETTWGDPACRPTNSEQALVEFSEDGVNWIAPGITPGTNGTAVVGLGGVYNTCYNGSFDITPLRRAQYVRITDRTNPNWKVQGDGVDGFDVDGIVANYPQAPTPNCAYPDDYPAVCDYRQGVASQYATGTFPYTADPANVPGRGIASQRKNIANANMNEAGFPVAAFSNPGLRDSGPASGSYNFWSIGFGGYACFRTEYTLVDGPGNDIYVFETTWNNQPCPNYNEKARVQVSADGINWSSPVTICKDALSIPGTSSAIDLAAYGPGFEMVNFIRFEDASSPADFGGGADGYDIDNIVFAQIRPACPGEPNPNFSCDNAVNVRRSFPAGASTFMEGGVPEEMFALELVGSNIVTSKLSFKATIAEEGGYFYTVRSATGQQVMSGELSGNLFETPVADISVSGLTNGVYFLTLSSAGSKETVKFIKN
jgi:hypothetical protein